MRDTSYPWLSIAGVLVVGLAVLLYRHDNRSRQGDILPKTSESPHERSLSRQESDEQIMADMANLRTFFMQGRYADVVETARRLVNGFKADESGAADPRQLYAANFLPTAYFLQGLLPEAVASAREVVSLHQRQPIIDHAQLHQFQSQLGYYLLQQGKLDEAEDVLRTLLADQERTLGADNMAITHTLECLAGACFYAGKYDQAERFHQRVRDIRALHLGESNLLTISSLWSLAQSAEMGGHFDVAAMRYQKLIAFYEQFMGKRHPMLAGALDSYSVLLHKMGDHEAATSIASRAKDIRSLQPVLNTEMTTS